MKTKLSVWLAILLAVTLLLAGCEDPEAATEPHYDPPVPTTVMIYMVGSDLESKSGAASRDLEEIAASGVDAKVHNIVVMAGGTQKWHNEVVGENSCALLELTTDGFQLVQTMESVSMGEAKTLADFVNYGYENYPAERYALILWDHGNGPVMGYGMDTLYESDGLLLSEMQEAMSATPFQGSNKLAWVGFDACLMASAELACVWDDYAEYLVASQEIEPSFGWNYATFGKLGVGGVEQFLTRVTDDYMAACEAYYQERGYQNRDTTLSCLDLSCAAEMEQALEALFSKAFLDVEQKYTQLAVQRVRSRALGRATTGSEYDLIDVGDMAVQVSESYPQETAKLQEVLDRMVIANATNTEGCCGLSLYYPFFNKYYYENSWQDIYKSLNVLPTYHKYLEAYERIWQKSDQEQLFSSGVAPQAGGAGEYYLQLTEEQNANFVSARFRILESYSEDLYDCIFESSDVTNDNGLLTAKFNGKVFYFRDKYGTRAIPFATQTASYNGLQHFQLRVTLDNSIDGVGAPPLGKERVYQVALFNANYDLLTQQFNVASVVPFSAEADEQTLMGGKQEELDLSQWSCVNVLRFESRWLARNEAGAVIPFDQWEYQGAVSYTSFYYTNEPELIYDTLDGGEYYLMIEAQDIYGNYHASELLPITLPETEPAIYDMPENQVHWKDGDRVLLKDQNGVRLFLTAVPVEDHVEFVLELENNNDFSVYLTSDELVCNDIIYCDSYLGSVLAKPHTTTWTPYTFDLGPGQYAGDFSALDSLSFQAVVRSAVTGEALIDWEYFWVGIDEKVTAAFGGPVFPEPTPLMPFLGAHAGKQVIYSDDNLKVTLIEFGAKTEGGDAYGLLRADNLTDQVIYFGTDGLAINKECRLGATDSAMIPAGMSFYYELSHYKYSLTKDGITGIWHLSIPVTVNSAPGSWYNFADVYWCDVTLDSTADPNEHPSTFREGTQIIYDQNDIRIAVDPAEADYSDTTWRLTIVNNSIYDISMEGIQVSATGSAESFSSGISSYHRAGAGMTLTDELRYDVPMDQLDSLTFTVRILDYTGGKILFTATEPVTLTVEH